MKYLILALFLVGCSRGPDEAPNKTFDITRSGYVNVYEDKERGVVCYHGVQAISCLKLNPAKKETK